MIENPARVEERNANKKLIERWTDPRYNRVGRTGAASELVVCVDLMRKGWDVFRSVSVQCVCDLIAIKGPCLIRVEVRTSSKKGTKLTANRHGTYDVFAIVRGFEILYKPDLPVIGE